MPNLAFVNAELIVQEGGLPPLVDLLASSNEGIQQQAAGALWSLSVNGLSFLIDFSVKYVFTGSLYAAENHLKIVREGSLPYIVRLLQSQNPKIQEQAAGILRNLAVNGKSKLPEQSSNV